MTLNELIAKLTELRNDYPHLEDSAVLYDEGDGEFLTKVVEAEHVESLAFITDEQLIYNWDSLDCDARAKLRDTAVSGDAIVLRRD